MNGNHGFVFYADRPPFDEQEDFIAEIPASVGDTKTLFDVYSEKLQLPGYFGFNWNALSECLRDLAWIVQYRVILLHHDLPNLETDDLAIYLDVLQECTESWKPGEHHKLVVAFPNEAEIQVLNILHELRERA